MSDQPPLHLERDIMGRLLLRGPEGMLAPVHPVRLFPLSCPEGYIALLDNDEKEIGLVQEMATLDPESRQALQAELAVSYLLPQIERILSVHEEFGVLHWHVRTNRGERQFDVRGRDEIFPVALGRYLVRDIDGNRYEIHDFYALDAHSQALVDIYL